jgi:hypothetical protein
MSVYCISVSPNKVRVLCQFFAQEAPPPPRPPTSCRKWSGHEANILSGGKPSMSSLNIYPEASIEGGGEQRLPPVTKPYFPAAPLKTTKPFFSFSVFPSWVWQMFCMKQFISVTHTAKSVLLFNCSTAFLQNRDG